MSHYKIIFAGPVGAGKTTAVTAASDIPPVRTDTAASDDVRDIKPQTTVALDYGAMKLGDGSTIHLYGTPGQERFDFMWDILTYNALGLVLMISASAEDPVADLRTYVEHFRQFIDSTALVVGITHADLAEVDVRPAIARELVQLGLPTTVMDTDARDRAHMAMLVRSLIYSIDPLAGTAR